MNFTNPLTMIIFIILGLIIISCSIGIIIASKFQSKQKEKYKICLDAIENFGMNPMQVKEGLSKEDISKIDESINVDELTKNLYDKYLEFQNKINTKDSNLDNLLTGMIKDLYIDRIDRSRESKYEDIVDNIDLIGYSITEFDGNKLKFKIIINCCKYKLNDGVVVSGSNLNKLELILLVTYIKENGDWLINEYEKVYEKKLDSNNSF